MKRCLLVLFLLGCGGGKTLEAKMEHAEDQARAAERLLDDADKKMEALEADSAEGLLDDAKEKLDDPDIVKYPEHKMLRERLAESRTKLAKLREEIAKRELEKAVLAQKQMLETASTRLNAALEALKKLDGDSEVREVRDAAEDLKDKLENGKEIEAKDQPLAEYSDGLRKTLEKAAVEAQKGERVVEFREIAGRLLSEGNQIAEQARAEKDKAKQRALDVEAMEKFRECASKTKTSVEGAPELAKVKMDLEGKATTVEGVGAYCEKQREVIEKRLKKGAAPLAAELKKKAQAVPAPKKKKKKK